MIQKQSYGTNRIKADSYICLICRALFFFRQGETPKFCPMCGKI